MNLIHKFDKGIKIYFTLSWLLLFQITYALFVHNPKSCFHFTFAYVLFFKTEPTIIRSVAACLLKSELWVTRWQRDRSRKKPMRFTAIIFQSWGSQWAINRSSQCPAEITVPPRFPSTPISLSLILCLPLSLSSHLTHYVSLLYPLLPSFFLSPPSSLPSPLSLSLTISIHLLISLSFSHPLCLFSLSPALSSSSSQSKQLQLWCILRAVFWMFIAC